VKLFVLPSTWHTVSTLKKCLKCFNSKGFWQWHVTCRITYILHFVHCTVGQVSENRSFCWTQFCASPLSYVRRETDPVSKITFSLFGILNNMQSPETKNSICKYVMLPDSTESISPSCTNYHHQVIFYVNLTINLALYHASQKSPDHQPNCQNEYHSMGCCKFWPFMSQHTITHATWQTYRGIMWKMCGSVFAASWCNIT
jgi:hypothetical protein